MSENYVSIDVASETVYLVGESIIKDLLTPLGRKLTLDDFNKLAVSLLNHFGHHENIDLEKIEPENWTLGCATKEDTLVLLSYLEDPRTEIAAFWKEPVIEKPVVTKPTLH